MGGWINWYGDLNLAVKTAVAFFVFPAKFIITWFFLICLLFFCGSVMANIRNFLRKQSKVPPELLLLAVIVFAGFLLRFNGFVRHSSDHDELYSACLASNPGRPFSSAFEDPGNPPFYFILLRLWFTVFGWTEQSGRMLSVLLGSAAIVSLYALVKCFSNKKAALLAAVFISANTYLIVFSQTMRSYTLEVFLVSIVVLRFLLLLQKEKQTIANMIWYIIPSVLLVNTHYYGVLLVFANFLFYIIHSAGTKTFSRGKAVLFFTANIFIALSLLPFFIHTALQKALFERSFNTWIPKPEHMWKQLAIFFLVLLIPCIYPRKHIFRKYMSGSERCLLDYSFFAAAAVLLMAAGFSLYRPILLEKYLVILYPLLLADAAIVIINTFKNSPKPIAGLCVVFTLAWTASGYEAERDGGGNNVYQESLAYIVRDAESHARNKSAELGGFFYLAEMYNRRKLPLYVPGDQYDVLFFNPSHSSDKDMYLETARLGISPEQVLRIRVNESASVFKIYP